MTTSNGMHVTDRAEVMEWLHLVKNGSKGKEATRCTLRYLRRHAKGEYLVMLNAALFVLNCI